MKFVELQDGLEYVDTVHLCERLISHINCIAFNYDDDTIVEDITSLLNDYGVDYNIVEEEDL